MITDQFANEGWRKAASHDERAFEAAKFFGKTRNGSPMQQALLMEAFSTPDFAVLLADSFTKKAIAAQHAAKFDFDDIVYRTTLPDFERHKLIDLWSLDEFERVGEGEEYQGGKLEYTDLDHATAKWGKTYKLTFELQLRRLFAQLADFPKFLGNAATRARNTGVGSILVADNGSWNSELFGTSSNLPLTHENVLLARTELAKRLSHRKEAVDISDMRLVVGTALQDTADRIVGVTEVITKVTSGTKTTETRENNPLRGNTKVLASRTLDKRLGANADTAWALVQSKDTDLPSIIETGLEGHDGNVDIRVKADQGQRVGGGNIAISEGSFRDDTIEFRGRDFFDHDKGFTPGVWASAGK